MKPELIDKGNKKKLFFMINLFSTHNKNLKHHLTKCIQAQV